MLFASDWLTNLFLFVFLFGLIFTVASLLLGFVGMGGHAPQVPHVGGHGQGIHGGAGGGAGGHNGGGTHGGGHDGPGLLNMPTIMAFLTWFGGVGYVLRSGLNLVGFLAVPLALLSGLVGAAVMFALLARVLWPMMSKPMSRADYDLPGTPARVVSSIREGGVGEIVYSKSGSRFTAGARSIDGSAIPKGAEVVIIRYERGIAHVQDVNAILSGASEETEAQVR